MRYYAVIDTNVLVSSLMIWDSIPGDVLNHIYHGKIIPVISNKILTEYEEVLNREKFKFPKEKVKEILMFFSKKGILIEDVDINYVSVNDPKDVVFYQVTMEIRKKENTYLVTGNIKHFPKESFIVTPRQMLDIIENNT